VTTTITQDPSTETVLWDTPAGTSPRGNLILLTGRGEQPDVYARFGRRLSSDGYRVHVVTTGPSGNGREKAAELLATSDPGIPRVVLGSDTGAAFALETGATGPKGKARPDAVIIAALPLGTADTALPDAEARSACPIHRNILADTANLESGSLAQPFDPDVLPEPESVQPPVLLFHGELDPAVPVDDAAEWAARLPQGRLIVTADGLRDAFNDKSHRSVAATLVLFLEDLRAGEPLLK
jgi:alpha-beta hydrolase superfamily lysophospholipase